MKGRAKIYAVMLFKQPPDNLFSKI